jgi:hypothetical protein
MLLIINTNKVMLFATVNKRVLSHIFKYSKV